MGEGLKAPPFMKDLLAVDGCTGRTVIFLRIIATGILPMLK